MKLKELKQMIDKVAEEFPDNLENEIDFNIVQNDAKLPLKVIIILTSSFTLFINGICDLLMFLIYK